MHVTRSLPVLVGAVLSAALTACAGTTGYGASDRGLRTASRVVLAQPLHLPGRAARVYIQYGEVTRHAHLNEWQPYCSFGLDRTRDGEPLVREIRPTVFTVRQSRVGVDVVWQGRDGPSGAADGALRVAGLLGGGGGTPFPYVYYSELELFAADQPQVDDLSCRVTGGPPRRNLDLEQVREALGEVARVE